MVHYKLTYFNGRGRAELARVILAVAGQEYEDHRIEFSEWPALKDKTPFGQLPVLEVDGKEIGQSMTIARYLARKFGLAGKNAWEEAQADAIVDQGTDLGNDIQKFMSAAFGFSKDDKEQLKKEVLMPGLQKHLPLFTKILKANGSGYLVGNGLTWADINVAGFNAMLRDLVPEALDGFPELQTHQEKILSHPKIKEWVEKRPKTHF